MDTNLTLICVLTYSGTFPQIQVQPVYFNDPAVKKAIHAPVDVQWTECANGSVFVGSGDTSLPSSFEVLPRILAHGVPTVVVTGLADFAVLSEGWVFFYLAFDNDLYYLSHLQNTHWDPKVSAPSFSSFEPW